MHQNPLIITFIQTILFRPIFIFLYTYLPDKHYGNQRAADNLQRTVPVGSIYVNKRKIMKYMKAM